MCENLNMYNIKTSWKKGKYYWERDSIVLDVFLENLLGEENLVLSSVNSEEEEFLGLLKYLVPLEIINECKYRFKYGGRSKNEQLEYECDVDWYNNEMNRYWEEN